MDLWCEFCKNKCCLYLPGVPQTERKGHKERRTSARRPGLRILGPAQKAGMVNVHLAVHKHFSSMVEYLRKAKAVGSIPANAAKECTASGKKINLLFCNMNKSEGRTPTDEKLSSKCNSKRWQSPNPARKNVPKGNL